MVSLTIVLAVGILLGLARTLLKRRDERPTAIVASCTWRKAKKSVSSQHRRHDSSSQQDLGKVLAYLSQLYEIPLNAGERFFVKTGLSPYCHYCVDDFIPMGCPACEWSSRHRDLINWRGGALVRLAQKLKAQRSTQMLLDSEPSNKLAGSSAAQ